MVRDQVVYRSVETGFLLLELYELHLQLSDSAVPKAQLSESVYRVDCRDVTMTLTKASRYTCIPSTHTLVAEDNDPPSS